VTVLAPDAATQALTVRVEEFEGPLDLLLHLCRTNTIDLARLPIRTITDQYLAHLEAIQFQDVESAGAFLVLAATLIYLKSKRRARRSASSWRSACASTHGSRRSAAGWPSARPSRRCAGLAPAATFRRPRRSRWRI